MRFHQAVAAASGRRILTALVDMVGKILYDLRIKTVKRARDLKESAQMHRRIYQAIRSHDPAAAREAMREHPLEAKKVWEQEEGWQNVTSPDTGS